MKNLKNYNKEVKLSPSQLRWICPPEKLNFSTTEELAPLDKIVGQPRAIESIRMGAKLWARGYNMFVTGLSGTGRMTAVKQILDEITTECPMLYDFLYVNNFKDTSKPFLIRLHKGTGRGFQKAIKDNIDVVKLRLSLLFEEEPFHTTRKKIIEKYNNTERKALKDFDKKIEADGFVRGQLELGSGQPVQEIFVIVNGEPVQIDQIDEIASEAKIKVTQIKKIKSLYIKYKDELVALARESFKKMKGLRAQINVTDKAAAKVFLDNLFLDITDKYKTTYVQAYIEDMKEFILDNLALYVPSTSIVPIPLQGDESIPQDIYSVFEVNLLLDNSETNCAPTIIERIPNYTNLFGTFDKVYDARGFWRSDFSKIKTGSLLQADQGYLIVNADDLFSEPGVWQALKRVLLYGKLEMQTVEQFYQMAQSHLKPEPIDVNLKIIIIGGQTLYRFLYENEKGFKKIFKVNAQFDYETDLTDEYIGYFSQFIAKICKKENLPHCTQDGVAEVIQWAVAQSGSQTKITLKFSDVADLLREASFYDRDINKKFIDKEDVKKAIYWKRKRSDLYDEKMKQSIIEGDVLIDTFGSRVGQINGLTVMDTGQYSFGKPARITANVSAGDSGIINVEREVDLSGAIHDKAVMIINSYLQENFGKIKPISLSISIAFEQNYGGIDGDSASIAEMYVLYSALTGIPLTQQLAITGSMNQKGDVQPIGGLNEKITGYFEICRDRGLTGNQGVVIPVQNVKDLMLDDEITEAVEQGKFHVYSINRIEEGVKLFFGIEYEEFDKHGNLAKNCLKYLIEHNLEELRLASESVNKKTKKKK